MESLVLPYGFALLQEISFNFLVYCQADVASATLREALASEYREILHSLVASKQLFDETAVSARAGTPMGEARLGEYMRLKSKKMNQKMMVLADCISLEEPLPADLLPFV